MKSSLRTSSKAYAFLSKSNSHVSTRTLCTHHTARITTQSSSCLHHQRNHSQLDSTNSSTRGYRAIHTSSPAEAEVAPFYATGPPPDPPEPDPTHPAAKVARRKKQAELLRKALAVRDEAKKSASGKRNVGGDSKDGLGTATNTAAAAAAAAVGGRSSPLKRRFWADVHVDEVDGHLQISLDDRPLRHPTTKAVIRLPLSKPHLADALALEWDLLTSAQQATKQHLIPMTSLICRAIDIAEDDKRAADTAAERSAGTGSDVATRGGEGGAAMLNAYGPIRIGVTTMLLRYLDTDSLLCWAPPPNEEDLPPIIPGKTTPGPRSLHEAQQQTATRIVSYLTTTIWPGVELEPVLDEGSIFPKGQKPGVREVIQGWIMGLDAWDLAGLERAALAGKSVLGAARLLVEWSEGTAGLDGGSAAAVSVSAATAKAMGAKTGPEEAEEELFSVEVAAKALSLEVDWQTKLWGEVEDTHDVEKEDLRRQLGSVVLLVSGQGAARPR